MFWIDKLEPEIAKVSTLPIRSVLPDFPLDFLIEEIKKTLSIKELNVSVEKSDWILRKDYFKGIENPRVLPVKLLPLTGTIFWIIPEKDVTTLISIAKNSDSLPLTLKNQEVINGVYRFLVTQVLYTLKNLDFYGNINPQLSNDSSFEEKSYSMEIVLFNDRVNMKGRLLVSYKLVTELKKRLSQNNKISKNLNKLKNLSVPMSITTGKIELSQNEFKSLKKGDLLLGDISYRPSTTKGWFLLKVNNTPIFQVKIKEGTLKIMDFYQMDI